MFNWAQLWWWKWEALFLGVLVGLIAFWRVWCEQRTIGDWILSIWSFTMELGVLTQVWFMLVCGVLALFWCWPLFWRLAFIGASGSPRLGRVFIGVYDEWGVWIFFWVIRLYTMSFGLMFLYCQALFVLCEDLVINKFCR